MLTRCSRCNSEVLETDSGLCPHCGHFDIMGDVDDLDLSEIIPASNPETNDKSKREQLLTLGSSVWSDLKHLKKVMESFSSRYYQMPFKNKRSATRFIRDDITATVNVDGLFGSSKTIAVELRDITSKGALISAHQELIVNKKIQLTLHFKSGKIFVINAQVVRHTDKACYEYGIKYDRYNDELGDYLLETQQKLVFK